MRRCVVTHAGWHRPCGYMRGVCLAAPVTMVRWGFARVGTYPFGNLPVTLFDAVTLAGLPYTSVGDEVWAPRWAAGLIRDAADAVELDPGFWFATYDGVIALLRRGCADAAFADAVEAALALGGVQAFAELVREQTGRP